MYPPCSGAGSSTPIGRMTRVGTIPGALSRAGIHRAVGAGKRPSFRAVFPCGKLSNFDLLVSSLARLLPSRSSPSGLCLRLRIFAWACLFNLKPSQLDSDIRPILTIATERRGSPNGHSAKKRNALCSTPHGFGTGFCPAPAGVYTPRTPWWRILDPHATAEVYSSQSLLPVTHLWFGMDTLPIIKETAGMSPRLSFCKSGKHPV